MVFIQQQRGRKGCSWQDGAVTCQSIVIGMCTRLPIGFVGIFLVLLVAGCRVWEGQRYVIGVSCPFPCSSQQGSGVQSVTPPAIENATVLRDEVLRTSTNKSAVDDSATSDQELQQPLSESSTRSSHASMVDKATMDTIVRDKRASKAASSSIYPIAPHALDPYDDIPDMVKMFWKPDCGGKCRREFQCFASPQRTVFNSALQSLLGEWLRIVDHLNMTAMLHCGSLIASLYRNGTRMRWDHDFDANIWAHDTVLLKRYANTYNAMQGNFDLSIQPNWKKKYDISRKDLGGRELYRFRGHRGFASGNARLYHRKTGKFMDVYPMYADNHGGEEGKDYVVDNNYTNITIKPTAPMQRSRKSGYFHWKHAIWKVTRRCVRHSPLRCWLRHILILPTWKSQTCYWTGKLLVGKRLVTG